jgi:hypothetical protein
MTFEHVLLSEAENKQEETYRNMPKLDADNMADNHATCK